MKIKGIVNAYLVDEDNNLIKEYPAKNNFLTKGGKSLLAANGIGGLMTQSLNLYGGLSSLDALYHMSGSSSTIYGMDMDNYRSLTLILAEIDTNKNKDSLNIPVFTDNSITSDRVIGYANNDIIPNADGIGGMDAFVNETPDPVFYGYLKDSNGQARRFKFDLNTAVGTFNAIILTPYTNAVLGILGGGVRTMKHLDAVNMIYQNYSNCSTAFIPPEITGITGEDEVISNYSQDTFTRHKVNLETGAVSNLPNNTSMPNLNMRYVTDMWYDGSQYLYVHDRDSNTSSRTTYVSVHDVLDGFKIKTFISISTLSSQVYIVGGYFVRHGGKLYVSVQTTRGSSYYEDDEYCLFELGHNGDYYATVANRYTDFSEIGWTNNTGLSKAFIGLKTMQDGTFAVFVPQIDTLRGQTNLLEDMNNLTGYSYNRQAYILPSMASDLEDAIINHKWLTSGSVIHATTTGKHRVFSIGKNMGVYDLTSNSQNGVVNQKFSRYQITNLTKPSSMDTLETLYYAGLYYSTAEQSHAHISVFKTEEPITKTMEQRLFIAYALGLEDTEEV